MAAMRLTAARYVRWAVGLGLLVAIGCQEPKSKTATDLDTDQRTAALRVPAASLSVATRIRNGEAETTATLGTLPALGDKIVDSDFDLVVEILEASDDAGKDPAYGLASREMATTASFFEEEREPLTKKVGGSVAYAAKQKGCDVDAWGAVSASLKDGVKERIEKRMQSANDGFLILERNQDVLGKKNLPTLELLAAEIAKASYFVNVQMEFAEEDLNQARSSAEDAKSSIQKLLDEEKEPAKGTAKPSADSEKSKKERVALAEERLKMADEAITQTTKELERIKERRAELSSAYDKAFSDLIQRIKAKKK